MYTRNFYLDKIKPFINKPVIKVIIGMRRVGKSYFLKQIIELLKQQDVAEKNILYIDKEQLEFDFIQNYISYFLETFAVYKMQRYDIKGKRVLEIHEKYFTGDVGIRHAILSYRDTDISGVLENLVFLELKRRNYSVYIGKVNDKEIDFIAEKEDKRVYIQVAYLLASKETMEREFTPLQLVKDNYPKYVLSMDTILGSDYEGIKRLNIIDFLLSDES